MTDYTPTGKPDDLTRYDARAVRREFDLVAVAVNSKANIGASSTTSSTSMLVESPATKTFVVGLNEEFVAGQTVFIADSGNPSTNNMTGILNSYASTTTGLMNVSVTSHNGSGTKTSWTIGVSNQSGVTLVSNTFTGHQNFARATVASHATTADIWNAAGNQINFTGIAAVTDFPDAPQAGAERVLICAGACSFTASADMKIDGLPVGGVLSCSADDTVTVRAVSTTQFRLSIIRYSGNNGGADSTSSAVDVTLTAFSAKVQNVSMTAPGKSVILPDATKVSEGYPVFAIKNSGVYPFDIKKNDAGFLRRLDPRQATELGCTDNSTAAGVWVPFGEVLGDICRGNTSEVLNAADSRVISVAMLSATKAIAIYRDNATGFLNAVILNYGAVSGTPVAINAESSTAMSVAALTSTQAVVAYTIPTGAKKGYVLDVSGNTITPGVVASLDATASGAGVSLTPLSSTQLLFGYYDGANNERVLTVSASAISVGAEVVADATASSGLVVVGVISATKALYTLKKSSGSLVVLRLQSISGTTPAPTGSSITITTSSRNERYDVVILDANRAVVVQDTSNAAEGNMVISLIDISGTSPVLLYNKVITVGLFTAIIIGDAVKLDSNRVYVTFTGSGSLGVDAFILTVSGDDRLFVGPITEAIETDVTSAAGYLACAALDSSHVMSVCRNSSTYLAVKVVEIAS